MAALKCCRLVTQLISVYASVSGEISAESFPHSGSVGEISLLFIRSLQGFKMWSRVGCKRCSLMM